MKPDGGSAFPIKGIKDLFTSTQEVVEEKGMTLRDYFAAKALQTFIVEHEAPAIQKEVQEKHARIAYEYADAMLAERNK